MKKVATTSKERLVLDMLFSILTSQERIARALATLAIKAEAGHAALEFQNVQRELETARALYRKGMAKT